MNRKGFTLIELLIVVAIISILAGIVLVGLRPSLDTTRDARRAAELRQIQTALQLYYNRFGVYPPALGDLATVNGVVVPNDPNGNSYYYKLVDPNKYYVGAKMEGGRSKSLDSGHTSGNNGDAADLQNGNDSLDCSTEGAYCLTF
jgi:prepilin-type N-terminal cleavage/methylation domain-containing protein